MTIKRFGHAVAAKACMLALAVLLLVSCASQSTRPAQAPVSGSAEQHQQARATALAALREWSLQGRVAISNGRDGGSGRIDWAQQGDGYQVALSAPVTRQSWTLSGAPGKARLDGIKGGSREGADADLLLREATGWDIPVQALAQWVRGLPAPAELTGEARLAYAGDGRLQRIEQDGWTIDYADWAPAPAGIEGVELPNRLTATRGQARVRLIVDQWVAGAAAP